jgi:hypothetical protein
MTQVEFRSHFSGGKKVHVIARDVRYVPYFLAYKMHWPIRHTLIFSLEILEENNDECILILVIYWKKTGLLRTKIINHNVFIHHRNPENHCHCH